MQTDAALDALTDVVAEALSAGITSAIAAHDRVAATGRDLRDGALVQALVGPALGKLLAGLTGETGRKTALRYAACLDHPRFGREQLIDEAENADASLATALLALQMSPGPANAFLFALAAIRVRAVTEVVGPDCIYPPREAGAAGRRGRRQRRREIGAADVPDALAAVLLRPVASAADLAAVAASLRALETTDLNRGALVTKLLALIELPDGHVHLNVIAERLARGRFRRDDSEPSGVPAVMPATTTASAEPIPASDPAAGTMSVPVLECVAAPRPAPLPVPLKPGGPGLEATAGPTPAPAAVPRLRTRFELRGASVPSAEDRLAQAHAAHRERSR